MRTEKDALLDDASPERRGAARRGAARAGGTLFAIDVAAIRPNRCLLL
ncbi:hypothetical protein [Polyangium sp. y55x31]|nr:hypothetical protein [Polyangium sp. y55x31]MDI1476543.1 hypothetical protein [Polyangium sp. y55x31]